MLCATVPEDFSHKEQLFYAWKDKKSGTLLIRSSHVLVSNPEWSLLMKQKYKLDFSQEKIGDILKRVSKTVSFDL